MEPVPEDATFPRDPRQKLSFAVGPYPNELAPLIEAQWAFNATPSVRQDNPSRSARRQHPAFGDYTSNIDAASSRVMDKPLMPQVGGR